MSGLQNAVEGCEQQSVETMQNCVAPEQAQWPVESQESLQHSKVDPFGGLQVPPRLWRQWPPRHWLPAAQ